MFKDLLNLFYPRTCFSCEESLDKKEKILCTSCLHDLPINHSLLDKENSTTKVFYGRVKIENATSLLNFEKKGMVQNIIHNLKYRGHEEISGFLGKWLAQELANSEEYKKIDIVIPVPLHKQRYRERGYNQVEGFGKQLALILKAEYIDDVLLKKTASSSQTYKRRLSRWGAIEETFILKNQEKIKGAHILLVDDLITTGATLEACSSKLLEVSGVKISIATMAIAG